MLLAALIGGITLARKDLTPAEEEEGRGGMTGDGRSPAWS